MARLVFGFLVGGGLIVSIASGASAANAPAENEILHQALGARVAQGGSASVDVSSELIEQDPAGDQLPEPEALLILGAGIAGIASAVRRKR